MLFMLINNINNKCSIPFNGNKLRLMQPLYLKLSIISITVYIMLLFITFKVSWTFLNIFYNIAYCFKIMHNNALIMKCIQIDHASDKNTLLKL